MMIARIFAHRVALQLFEGPYQWSGGKSVSVFDSTIVDVETDGGLVGYGEIRPLGPFTRLRMPKGCERDSVKRICI